MGEVIRHFDGNLAPIACVSSTGYKYCSQEAVFKAEPVTREEVFKETLICGAGI